MTSTLNEPEAGAGDTTAERLDALERDLQGYRVSRDAWTFVIFGIALLTAIASIVGIGLALRDDDDDGAEAGPAAAPIQAELSEFAISLSAASIDVGGSIEVTNAGSQAHNLGVEGTDLITPDIEPGESATLDLSSLEAGTYTLYCDIPGHADSGMTTPLVIGAAADGEAAAAGGHADHAAMTPEQGGRPRPGDDGLDPGVPRRDRGPRQPTARAGGAARRHEALRADRRHRRLGGAPR